MIQQIVTNLKELRRPCAEVQDGEDISAIVEDLRDTLDMRKGYGLAANQIGINKKVAYYELTKNAVVLINPRIVEKSKKVSFREGCLSFPGLEIITDRYDEIVIENSARIAGEMKFGARRFSANGLEAIIIQHEIDHLNGITILNRKHKAR